MAATASTAAASAAGAANSSSRLALLSTLRALALGLWGVAFAFLLVRQQQLLFPTHFVATTTTSSFGAPPTGPLTVGVAVTITGCGEPHVLDGAVVLRHSFLRHSFLRQHQHQEEGRYRYQFYAIYHPEAADCVSPLAKAGYVLLERPTPVIVSAIQGEYLRRTIPHQGAYYMRTSQRCHERRKARFVHLSLSCGAHSLHWNLRTHGVFWRPQAAAARRSSSSSRRSG
jgi:hypothetical protein